MLGIFGNLAYFSMLARRGKEVNWPGVEPCQHTDIGDLSDDLLRDPMGW